MFGANMTLAAERIDRSRVVVANLLLFSIETHALTYMCIATWEHMSRRPLSRIVATYHHTKSQRAMQYNSGPCVLQHQVRRTFKPARELSERQYCHEAVYARNKNALINLTGSHAQRMLAMNGIKRGILIWVTIEAQQSVKSPGRSL